MEPASDAAAPDLELDDRSQYGFVKWFNGLPQVRQKRRAGCLCARYLISGDCNLGLFWTMQDATVVRFFDRKVRLSGPVPYCSLVHLHNTWAGCRVFTLCMARVQCSLQGSSTRPLLLSKCLLAVRMGDCLVRLSSSTLRQYASMHTPSLAVHLVCILQHCYCWAAGVTLNRSLYETVLRELLLERAEHTIELYEGSGAAWRKVR